MTTITRIDHDDLFIAGSFVRASATERFTAVNPATEEIVGTVPVANAAEVDHAVSAARTAFGSWSRTSPAERSEVLGRVADEFGKRAPEITNLVARQNGAPRWWVEQEIRIAEAAYSNAAKKAPRSLRRSSRPAASTALLSAGSRSASSPRSPRGTPPKPSSE